MAERPDHIREQLGGCLREHELEPHGQLMVLLALHEVDRLICSGRWLDGAHTYAAFAERVPAPRHLDRDEALAELALPSRQGRAPWQVHDR